MTEKTQPASRHVRPEIGDVPPEEHASLLGQQPRTIWLTGLPAAGKSTLARALERRLVDAKHPCFILDGDNLRHGLSRDLGFSREERHENIRRAAEVAGLMNDAGLLVVAAFISPFREDRAMARAIIGADRFVEVHLDADLATCERRDPKGLYRKARRGEIVDFTGVDAPYETPERPALTIDTANGTVEECVARVLDCLARSSL